MQPLDFASQTTLITGASSGIGAAFARDLAARGSALVLTARREDRLQALASELRSTHGVQVHAVRADLAQAVGVSSLIDALGERDIRVTSLINNAGVATFGPFHSTAGNDLMAEIAVDVVSVVALTRALIEDLRAGTGFLVNIASMAGYLPIPNMAVYGAAKAFVLSFTEAVWFESRGTALRVLAVSPGATETEFFSAVGTDAADSGTRRRTPEDVVSTTLRALQGREPGPSVIDGRVNRAGAAAGRLLPRRRAVLAMGARTAGPD